MKCKQAEVARWIIVQQNIVELDVPMIHLSLAEHQSIQHMNPDTKGLEL